jgi:hypothetical protein
MFIPGRIYRSKSFNKYDIFIVAAEKVGDAYRLVVRLFDRYDLLFEKLERKLTVKEENWERLS